MRFEFDSQLIVIMFINNEHFLLFTFFFFNDTAPTEISPLSLHDALPIPRPPPCRERPSGSAPSRPSDRRRFRWCGTRPAPRCTRHRPWAPALQSPTAALLPGTRGCPRSGPRRGQGGRDGGRNVDDVACHAGGCGVDHPAVELGGTAPRPRRVVERAQDAARALDLRRRRRE